MSIFVIGDLHLSLGGSKPMDVFPGWSGYLPRLEQNWRRLVKPEDTVLLPGDISWAMKLEDTAQDFAFLQSLPGQKLISKGNHDYWWTTFRKMETYLETMGFDTLHLLHNNSYLAEGKLICGTRGWMVDGAEPLDDKIMNREIGRLRASLDAACRMEQELTQAGQPKPEKLAVLHYPPLYPGSAARGILEVLREYDVQRCYYGHLHGSSIRFAVQGEVEGIRYKLVSADGLAFCPYKI